MVTFNELRISEDRKCLIVDCEIENIDVYANMYIQSIYLEYYQNATAAGMPSEKAYLMYENTSEDATVKGKRLRLSSEALPLTGFNISSFDDGLFYVIVNCGGDLPASVTYLPCGYDETTRIGVIIDWKSFYNKGMQFVAGLYGGGCSSGQFCESPESFEDFLILWNALKLAISTCNWDLVNELWRRFLRAPLGSTKVSSIIRSSGCGCR